MIIVIGARAFYENDVVYYSTTFFFELNLRLLVELKFALVNVLLDFYTSVRFERAFRFQKFFKLKISEVKNKRGSVI